MPGSASFGIVLPTMLANDRDGIRSLERDRSHRAGGDEGDETVVEVLPGVHVVVLLGQGLRHRQQPQADDLEALALEAADDLADESALDGIGLGQDEGALHDGGGSCC